MATKRAGMRVGEPVPMTKSERTRERIITAASATLSRLGYAGTRLADVAEEAGIQTPGIYYYFESRDRLIEEVVVVGTVRLREHVRAALATARSGATPMERIEIAIGAHLRQVMTDASFAHAVIRNQNQLPAEIRRRQQREERPYTQIWRDLFEEAREAGELRADLDPDLASALVAGSLNWATEWWTARRWPLEMLIDTAVSIALQGLAAEPANGVT